MSPAVVIIITGASRGYGRALAVEFAKSFGNERKTAFVLLGRNLSGLQATADLLHEIAPTVTTITHVIDMDDLETIETEFNISIDRLYTALQADTSSTSSTTTTPASSSSSLSTSSPVSTPPLLPSGFASHCILVHNAGSLGHMGMSSDIPSVSSLRTAIDSNITATIWLSSLFLRSFPRWLVVHDSPSSSPSQQQQHASASITDTTSISSSINGNNDSSSSSSSSSFPPLLLLPFAILVNISSLAAIKPFRTQAVYCIQKAARDMALACIAEEYTTKAANNATTVKTLNYAPGPLDTDMQAEIRASESVDPSLRAFFCEMKETGKYIDMSISASKCVRILRTNRYASGSHIDIYDEEP